MDAERRAVVTGANTGLGLAAATSLAAAGWSVTFAVRNTAKGEAAAATLRCVLPTAAVAVRHLDLADLDSVKAFAAGWEGPLQLLMNNAGMMLVPHRAFTIEGFEEQMGVNHLGHYLLTALLLPALTSGSGRVVTVSSIAHHTARKLDRGLGLTGPYTPMGGYGQSKLAVLMFALELDRRLRRDRIGVTSVAAHPGLSATTLTAPGDRGDAPSAFIWASRKATQLVGSPAEHGARSQLYAATAPDLAGGSFYGPRFGIYGKPHRAAPSKAARNIDDARWLFDASAELTGAVLLG